MPCLTVHALGANLSMEVFIAAYPILLWSFFHIFIAWVVAGAAARITGVPFGVRRVFVVALSFGNTGTLPLILIETLARAPPFADKEDSLDKMTTQVPPVRVGLPVHAPARSVFPAGGECESLCCPFLTI